MDINIDNLQTLFNQMKTEMANQTRDIISQMDQKLVPFTQEIQELKEENRNLKEKVKYLERYQRANNIIIYGQKELEQTTTDLMESIIKKIKTDLDISLSCNDINMIRRIGKKDRESVKNRPILVSFVNNWKKSEIIKNKKKLKDVHISEDFPKEVLDKRKELQTKMIEERNKGNYAVINYDKLIIREGILGKEKRKRTSSTSPNGPVQPRKQQSLKTNRINAFDAMRARSTSLSKCALPSENKL